MPKLAQPILERRSKSSQCLILAAGNGTSLRSVSSGLPRPFGAIALSRAIVFLPPRSEPSRM